MVKILPSAAESSHTDANQQFSLIGVQGTLGTSDTGGTAPTVPLGADAATGALYVYNLGASGTGGGGGSNVNIITGTIQSSGTTTGIGVLSNLTNGSVNILTGTIQSSGTTTGIGVVTALTNGSVNILTGTIQSSGTTTGVGVVTTVTSVSSLTTGSIVQTAGTTQINRIPTFTQLPFGTFGTTGATVFGTLAGGTSSGAGTEIFVTSLSISIPTTAGSQDVSIGFGTNGGTFHAGTGRLVRGNFPAGGGIQKTFDPPINSGTNAQLTYFQAGAGSVEVDVTFFTTASTL